MDNKVSMKVLNAIVIDNAVIKHTIDYNYDLK